jgi:hypothetical protein
LVFRIIFSVLLAGSLGGSGGVFPFNHLSVNNFSWGISLVFQYKAVVLILACPNIFCKTGKGMPLVA